MDWSNYFEYKDGKLFWKVGSRAGRRAGGARTDGYCVVRVQGVQHYVHRIVWEMHYGPIPNGMQVDHVWHNRGDNRVENLRLVDCVNNHRNKIKGERNTSGVVGVYWRKDSCKWEARIKVTDKIVNLGTFDNFEDAVKARKEAEVKFDFHENHGK